MSKTLNIKLLNHEFWWGGLVHEGWKMPFNEEMDYSINLYKHTSPNQTASILLSNKGRFLYSKESFSFAFGKGFLNVNSENEIHFSSAGNTLRDAYSNLMNLISCDESSSKLDSLLFSSPQYNTWIELMYDQNENDILEYADNILSQGYPSGVIMIDDNWQEDYGMWEFSSARFHSPKDMIDKLHSKGFKVMLWVCPFISPDSLLFRELRDKNFLVKDSTGQPAIREWWNGYSAVLDLSNPHSFQWFKSRLDNLIDTYGIDGFKFDAGDPEFYREDDITFGNVSPLEQCQLYNKLGLHYSLNEFRAAHNVGNLELAQRLCDKHHSWDEKGMKSLIPNALAQGLMGYAYSCPDMIGGGEYLNFIDNSEHLDEELFVRYAQCSALFPMMQFSAAPWRVLNISNSELCRQSALLHQKFAPYILELVQENRLTGAPIIRHMEYQYPHGKFPLVDTQFMLGSKILVAPVIDKGSRKKTIHFPEGEWLGDDDSIVLGPVTLEVDAPLSRLPYYIQK